MTLEELYQYYLSHGMTEAQAREQAARVNAYNQGYGDEDANAAGQAAARGGDLKPTFVEAPQPTYNTPEELNKRYALQQAIQEETRQRQLAGLRFEQEQQLLKGMPEGLPGWAQGEVNRARNLQATPWETGNINELRGRQMSLADALAARARGENSIAAAQSREAQQQIAGNIAAQTASAPGRFNPAIFRQGIQNMSSVGQQMAGKTVAARLAEQRDAENNLAALLSGARGQEQGWQMGKTQADRDWLLNREKLGLGWGELGLGDKRSKYQQMLDMWKTKYTADKQAAAAARQAELAERGQNIQIGGTAAGAAGSALATSVPALIPSHSSSKSSNNVLNPTEQDWDEFWGTGGWGTEDEDSGGGRGGDDFSDVRLKTNIAPARGEARQLLQVLAEEGPKQYDYDRRFTGDNPYHAYGPMAQTLEKGGPLGRAMVGKDAQGMRYLKQPQMEKGILTALSEQQKQIDELKGKGTSDVDRGYKPLSRAELLKVFQPVKTEPIYETIGEQVAAGALPPPPPLRERLTGRSTTTVYDPATGKWVNQASPDALARAGLIRPTPRFEPAAGEMGQGGYLQELYEKAGALPRRNLLPALAQTPR